MIEPLIAPFFMSNGNMGVSILAPCEIPTKLILPPGAMISTSALTSKDAAAVTRIKSYADVRNFIKY